jgi:hypothetical protein
MQYVVLENGTPQLGMQASTGVTGGFAAAATAAETSDR